MSNAQVNTNININKMSYASPKLMEDLGFIWTSCRLRDTSVCHGLMHDGPMQCFKHFLIKLGATGKVASRYYVIFHVIPLVLRLRKCKTLSQIPRVLADCVYEYGRSVLFMSFLVGLLRAGLCSEFIPNDKGVFPANSYVFGLLGNVSACSILFEQSSRRNQITYYITAKAIMAFYLLLKRNIGWNSNKQGVILHVLMMALLNYVYHHHSEVLKFKKVFEYILGQE